MYILLIIAKPINFSASTMLFIGCSMFPVVIIAAGVASRLKPYSNEMHKCLMELEPNVTILDFILNRLEKIS